MIRAGNATTPAASPPCETGRGTGWGKATGDQPPRALMTDADAIIARMGEDLAAWRGKGVGVTYDKLVLNGWTSAQIARHVMAAIDAARIIAGEAEIAAREEGRAA
jgi:hypothetical protein